MLIILKTDKQLINNSTKTCHLFTNVLNFQLFLLITTISDCLLNYVQCKFLSHSGRDLLPQTRKILKMLKI